MAREKLDLYKLHRDEYITPKTPAFVETKSAKYLAITGQGEPGGKEFSANLGALYNAAYTIKMASKRAAKDYKVCALEGLWWGTSSTKDLLHEPPQKWNWKLIIRTPDFITEHHLKEAIATLKEKGKGSEISKIKLEVINEGLCVQMLHVGPYANERTTLAVMKDFVEKKGLSFRSPHHEIYLSDPRRVAPERLRTILRMPVH